MSSARQIKHVHSARAYQLASLLKLHRLDANMSQKVVAASLRWSASKVGHIETLERPVHEDDVVLLLDLYGVAGALREEILALAREAQRRNWWTEYVGVLYGAYVALEDAASVICEWEPQVIPGLFQTMEYARSIISTDQTLNASDIEKRIDARRRRRKLLDREDAPHLRVVLDEAILNRQIGTAGEWREQLRRLADDAERDNVTLQILPHSAGVHPGIEGSLIVLRFADDSVSDKAYCEGFFGGVWMESPPKVVRCNVAFERLSDVALDREKSVALIKKAAASR